MNMTSIVVIYVGHQSRNPVIIFVVWRIYLEFLACIKAELYNVHT